MLAAGVVLENAADTNPRKETPTGGSPERASVVRFGR
jgi:hypothetical protein